MIGDRQTIGRFHRDFYRDYYYKVLNGLLVTSAIILLLILAIIYFIFFQPTPDYYASSLSGQVIPMVTLHDNTR